MTKCSLRIEPVFWPGWYRARRRGVLYCPTWLHRSLTLWWLLGRQGIASELRIGVRKEQGRFEAHSWVEYEGVTLNDELDVGSRFAAFQGLWLLAQNLWPN